MSGYGSNYPPNSGPPPPGQAAGPYNNYGQGYSAYNNFGGYGAYPGGAPGYPPPGGGPPGYGPPTGPPGYGPPGGPPGYGSLGGPPGYGPPGGPPGFTPGPAGPPPGGPFGGQSAAAVPGFTAPPMMPQNYWSQPQGLPQPQANMYSQAQHMQQQAALQQMQWQQFQKMGLIKPDPEEEDMRQKQRRRRVNVDEEEDDFDPEEEKRKMKERMERAEQKAKELQEKLANDESAVNELKSLFVREMQRRQDLSGTFEMTQGTVFPFVKYDEEDCVAKWYKKEKNVNIVGENWTDEYDCEYIRKAIRGWGTDEAAIIYLCSTRCNAQRNKMLKTYKTMYGRDLIKDLRGDTSGNFRDALIMMFYTPARCDAYEIKKAIYGLGTDEATLIEILLTRTNAQIQEINREYNSITYEKLSRPETSLEKDIIDDCSGDFKRLLIAASQGNRKLISNEAIAAAVEPIEVDGRHTGMFQLNEEKLVNMQNCKRKADELMKAGEERWGTDEETFNRIFSLEDHTSLRVIYNEYVKLSQRDILNSIDRETSGNFKKGLKAIAQVVKHRPMFFADKLYKSMKGLGTNDDDLIRIVVTRSEMDMVQIKACFLEKYKQTLWNFIKDDTSGDYRKLLLGLVGKN